MFFDLILPRTGIMLLVGALLIGCSSTGSKNIQIKNQVESAQDDDPFLIPARMPISKPPTEVVNPAVPALQPMTDRPQGANSRPQIPVTVAQLLPKGVKDTDGWASDMTVAFNALKLPLTEQNICATVAVIEQESSFNANHAGGRFAEDCPFSHQPARRTVGYSRGGGESGIGGPLAGWSQLCRAYRCPQDRE
jgi:Protein of unknown function (DUF1615)